MCDIDVKRKMVRVEVAGVIAPGGVRSVSEIRGEMTDSDVSVHCAGNFTLSMLQNPDGLSFPPNSNEVANISCTRSSILGLLRHSSVAPAVMLITSKSETTASDLVEILAPRCCARRASSRGGAKQSSVGKEGCSESIRLCKGQREPLLRRHKAAGAMPAHNCTGNSDDDILKAEKPGGWADSKLILAW